MQKTHVGLASSHNRSNFGNRSKYKNSDVGASKGRLVEMRKGRYFREYKSLFYGFFPGNSVRPFELPKKGIIKGRHSSTIDILNSSIAK
jgi:hypothetical protein